MENKKIQFVSRAGEKLNYALEKFSLPVDNFLCADFGCSTGGFTDCLLQHGAKKIYAIDTAYGVLDWKLRNDPRVVVMEKTNALYIELPEKMDLITIDTSWTRQEKIIPHALSQLKPTGKIISLIKPHYEASQKYLRKGKLQEEYVNIVLNDIVEKISKILVIKKIIESPIRGNKKGNKEFLLFGEPFTNRITKTQSLRKIKK